MNSKELAKKVRTDALLMTSNGPAEHIGPILSIADIVSVLYASVMKHDPKNPENPNRDRFILSKGHAGACIYATLAECGYFEREKLAGYVKNGSTLSGHVSHKNNPGVEFSTGSLGHGAGVGAGLALAARMDKKPFRVFVLCGNGEMNEGSIWETVMFAAQNKLSNFKLIIDDNGLQCLGESKNIIDMSNMKTSLESFGFKCVRVNGHDHKGLEKALSWFDKTQPTAVICDTVKGKGVSFMENNNIWHGKTVSGELLEQALKEVQGGK